MLNESIDELSFFVLNLCNIFERSFFCGFVLIIKLEIKIIVFDFIIFEIIEEKILKKSIWDMIIMIIVEMKLVVLIWNVVMCIY